MVGAVGITFSGVQIAYLGRLGCWVSWNPVVALAETKEALLPLFRTWWWCFRRHRILCLGGVLHVEMKLALRPSVARFRFEVSHHEKLRRSMFGAVD